MHVAAQRRDAMVASPEDRPDFCVSKNGTGYPLGAFTPAAVTGAVAAAAGNRIDDDLSLALELLDEWAADPSWISDQPSTARPSPSGSGAGGEGNMRENISHSF